MHGGTEGRKTEVWGTRLRQGKIRDEEKSRAQGQSWRMHVYWSFAFVQLAGFSCHMLICPRCIITLPLIQIESMKAETERERGISGSSEAMESRENTFDLPNQVLISERENFCVDEFYYDLVLAHVRPLSLFISSYGILKLLLQRFHFPSVGTVVEICRCGVLPRQGEATEIPRSS